MKGIEYLRNKLNSKSPRVKERYKQYEMKKDDHRQGIVIPNQLKYLYKANLGWCCKAVDCVADRLVFRQFAEWGLIR